MDKDKDDRRKSPFDEFFDRFFGFSKRSPFEDLFREFDEMFKRMQRDIGSFEELSPEEEKRSYTYGFNVFIGPDGKPKVKEFGNLKPYHRGMVKKEKYEPSSSTYTEDDSLTVVVDLPGVDKSNIDVNASEEEVEVSAEGEDREYHTTVELPEKVLPDSAEAKYENGVLTLTFKVEKKEEEKKNIKIK